MLYLLLLVTKYEYDTDQSIDDVRLPIHLLIYATQTAVTTLTCIADYMSWSSFSNAQKMEMGKLYVPYLALCKCFGLYVLLISWYAD